MAENTIRVLLADDDNDDCLLFKEALEELELSTQLQVVGDGEALINLLKDSYPLPDVLFLDLNMPRKNGFECLLEIKRSEVLCRLPVIIFSTSMDPEIVNMLYKYNAQYYIRKPNSFEKLKGIISDMIHTISYPGLSKQPIEKFIIHS